MSTAFPLPVQLQPFALAGAGAVIGNTSIVLKSMRDIDGNALSMSDFGVIGYGTLDPGNGSLEEQVSFTGLTNNANGTTTLSGISSVTFYTPFTATSGLLKTHAGATPFIISNDAGFYNQIKSYIDTALSAGAVPATTGLNGIGHVSVTPVDNANPVFVGDNDPRVPTSTEASALNGFGGTPSSTNKYALQAATAQTYTPTAAGTATLNLSLSGFHFITMPAGNITIALSNDTNNQIFEVAITQDAVGSRTVTWFNTIRWAGGGTPPTLTTTASKRDTFIFQRTGSGTYDGYIAGENI